MNARRRLPLPEVGDLLAPGEPLPFKVLDAQGRLLLAAGQRVDGPRQLSALLERGASVEYEDAEAVRRQRAAAAATAPAHAAAVRQRNLFDRWEAAMWVLDALLRKLGTEAVAPSDLQALADAHIAMVDREPEVALFKAVRQDDRRFALYNLTHALHTATVVLLSARLMGWPTEQQQRLVTAALTMNASISDLQARMAEQIDPPTKKQLDQIRGHPTQSAALLRGSGVQDVALLQTVEDHHERAQGGYPRGVTEVGELAVLLRAADVFMAKISPRALRAPMLPQLAARQLFQDEGGGPVAGALIRAVGVYPPGEFVRLKNGELAIVARRASTGLAVQAVVLQDARGKPVPGAPRRDTGQAEFTITAALPLNERAGLMRVLPEQVYGVLAPD
jgi:HD-GYP domain-containing protein (c-di-GMP phosphodiesterase class II)